MKKLLLVLFLSSCKIDLVGDKVAKIYPVDGYADVATIVESCPLKIGTIEEKSINELQGWVCVPESQAAKYRRDYSKDCK